MVGLGRRKQDVPTITVTDTAMVVVLIEFEDCFVSVTISLPDASVLVVVVPEVVLLASPLPPIVVASVDGGASPSARAVGLSDAKVEVRREVLPLLTIVCTVVAAEAEADFDGAFVADAKLLSVADTEPASVAKAKPASVADDEPASVSDDKLTSVADGEPTSVADGEPASVSDVKLASVLDGELAFVANAELASVDGTEVMDVLELI